VTTTVESKSPSTAAETTATAAEPVTDSAAQGAMFSGGEIVAAKAEAQETEKPKRPPRTKKAEPPPPGPTPDLNTLQGIQQDPPPESMPAAASNPSVEPSNGNGSGNGFVYVNPPGRKAAAPPKDKDYSHTQPPSPSLKAMGKLASILPGAERVEVLRITDDGTEAIVGEYRASDLVREGSIARFLLKFVVPKCGRGGDFHFWAINAKNERIDAGYASVDEPSVAIHGPKGEGGVTETLKAMKELLVDHAAVAPPPMMMPPPPPPSFVSQLKEMKELEREFGGQKDGGSMMMMYMQQQQQQQAWQMQQWQAAQQQHRPDSSALVMAAIERLAAAQQKLEERVMAAPPPLPPAPPDPMAVLGPLLAGMQNTVTTLIATVMKPSDDRLTTRDLITMMNQSRTTPEQTLEFIGGVMKTVRGDDKPGTDDFRGRMQDMVMLGKLARAMFGGGGGETTFADVLMKVLDAPAGSLGARMVSRLADPAGKNKQQAQQSKKQVASGQQPTRRMTEGRPTQPAATQAAPASPAQTAPATSPTPAAVAPAPSTPAADGAPVQQAQAEPAKQPEKKGAPPIPPGIEPLAQAIEDAPDERERIGAVLNLMQWLGTDEGWSPHMHRVLLLAAQGDQKALQMLRVLLHGLAKLGHLKPETATAAATAFENHFDEICRGLAEMFAAKKEAMESGDDDGAEELEDVLGVGADEED
jgi:hypothetical protein